MTSLVLFGLGAALMLLTIPIRFLERQRARRWFLSSRVHETKNVLVAVLDQKRQTLSRMGLEFTRLQLMLVAIVLMTVMSVLPLLFHEPWVLSAVFAVLGLLVFDLGIRLYGLRFNVRFEAGLRTSALLIGIESLTATGEAIDGVKDILRLSRDKLMLREFAAVKAVMETLEIPCEEAMLIRATEVKVPAYEWLARYTLKMRQFGANSGEAWQDVLEELEDRDILRTRILSKTSSIRFGAYLFGIALVIALLLFYHLILPLMTGMMPFIFGLIMMSVAIGIYRLMRLGGDVK